MLLIWLLIVASETKRALAAAIAENRAGLLERGEVPALIDHDMLQGTDLQAVYRAADWNRNRPMGGSDYV